MVGKPQKRGRGRPSISEKPGVRYMVHLPQDLADELKAAGGGSLSRGVIRTASGQPPIVTPARAKARKRAAARAKAATHE